MKKSCLQQKYSKIFLLLASLDRKYLLFRAVFPENWTIKKWAEDRMWEASWRRAECQKTVLYPGIPPDSIRLAKLTSSLHTSNCHFLKPMTPHNTFPVWTPILMSTFVCVISLTALQKRRFLTASSTAGVVLGEGIHFHGTKTYNRTVNNTWHKLQ